MLAGAFCFLFVVMLILGLGLGGGGLVALTALVGVGTERGRGLDVRRWGRGDGCRLLLDEGVHFGSRVFFLYLNMSRIFRGNAV